MWGAELVGSARETDLSYIFVQRFQVQKGLNAAPGVKSGKVFNRELMSSQSVMALVPPDFYPEVLPQTERVLMTFTACHPLLNSRVFILSPSV